jgi:hypothetical protein
MVDPVKKQKPDEKELRAREEAQRKQLGTHLKTVDAWIDRMQDPVLGDVGKAFKAATDKIIHHEDLDFGMKPSAVYHSFRYLANPGQTSFSNSVLYGMEALDSQERLLGAKTHEFVHALQYHKAASLHADPYNEASDIIVSPYDYILRKERLEQDAYVTGAWLCSLVTADAPGIIPAMSGSPLPVTTFNDIKAKSPSLQDAFEQAARDTRNLMGVWQKDAPKTVIADEWHARALEEYAHIIQMRMDVGEPLTFVRLDGPDILEIGDSFGPNTFGTNPQNPALTTIENLSPANAKKLEEINQKIGIYNRDTLPTLEQAITNTGMTRQQYLQQSKEHIGPARPDESTPKSDNDNQALNTTGIRQAPPPPPSF